jgi:hypothetical protein
MIFEGLTSPYVTGEDRPDGLYQAGMARIRQLSAHEMGHTLGMGHNYYSSGKGWISVLDYPHPYAELRPDGTIDISRAYEARIGDWDKVSVNWGYRQFPQGANEAVELRRILTQAWDADLRYLTNQDTDIHPRSDQWSNGTNQADELMRLMRLRRTALDRLGERTIRLHQPMATIEEPLVPIFMHHRYAVESTASAIGGQDFVYAMRGDGRAPTKWETAANQRKALEALAETLKPSELTIPRTLLELIPPRPSGYGMHRELFARSTGEAFDPLAPATIAADVTIGFTLQPDRAARMVAQNAVDSTLPGLGEVIERLTRATFDAATANSYENSVRRATSRVLVDRVTWLAAVAPNSQVRAIASAKLDGLQSRLRTGTHDELDSAHNALLAADIKRFLERPAETARLLPAPNAPPGAPIGGDMPQNWLTVPVWCQWEEQ